MTDLPGTQDNQPNPSGDTAQDSGEISIPDDTHQSQLLASKVEEGSGPLPTPNDLKEFNDIVPGFAKEMTDFYFAQASRPPTFLNKTEFLEALDNLIEDADRRRKERSG